MSSREYKRMVRDLECEKSSNPFKREILQIVHYYPGTTQIVAIKTPKGALDNVRCPVRGCGSLPKDPNA
jgi:hypothetical protein